MHTSTVKERQTHKFRICMVSAFWSLCVGASKLCMDLIGTFQGCSFMVLLLFFRVFKDGVPAWLVSGVLLYGCFMVLHLCWVGTDLYLLQAGCGLHCLVAITYFTIFTEHQSVWWCKFWITSTALTKEEQNCQHLEMPLKWMSLGWGVMRLPNPKSSSLPQMYGFPKIHKDGTPMRPSLHHWLSFIQTC